MRALPVKILHEILKLSYDQSSHGNNPVKILHEILKLSFDQSSHENNPVKILHEILQCLLTSAFMRALVKRHWRISCNIFTGLFS
jgi:hypothetical protein